MKPRLLERNVREIIPMRQCGIKVLQSAVPAEVGYDDPCRSKDTRVDRVVAIEASENHVNGTGSSASRKWQNH